MLAKNSDRFNLTAVHRMIVCTERPNEKKSYKWPQPTITRISSARHRSSIHPLVLVLPKQRLHEEGGNEIAIKNCNSSRPKISLYIYIYIPQCFNAVYFVDVCIYFVIHARFECTSVPGRSKFM